LLVVERAMALRPTLECAGNIENDGVEDAMALKPTSGFVDIEDVEGIESELDDELVDLPSCCRLRYCMTD